MAILREQSQLAAASAEDLLETLAALTGRPAPARFSSLAAGRARVANAMLAAENAAGHLGVAKDAKLAVLTFRERERARQGQLPIGGLPEDDAEPTPDVSPEPESDDRTPPPTPVWPGTERRAVPRPVDDEPSPPPPASNPFPVGSPEHQLWLQSDAPKEEKPPRRVPVRGSSFTTVKATFAGISKPQENSRRAACLKLIQDATREDGQITIDALEKQLGEPARGFVQKLLEKKHVEIVA